MPVLASIGAMLYPASGLLGTVGVGLAGGVGAAIGEIAGYIVGFSERGVIEKRKRYERLVGRVRQRGALAVFVLSLFFLVFDVVAIDADTLRLPLWQFVLACWLGRTILYVSIAVLAALGWNAVIPYLG